MNIFKALSEGNGKISETNITSFVNYLLDSANELNNTFFGLFAKLIDKQLEKNKLCELLNIKQPSIREQLIYISENYIISSEPEYAIRNAEGNKQIPDILLRITSKRTEEDLAFLIIENKINKSAYRQGQVEKQYNFFTQSEDYDTNKPVYSILITPDEKHFEKLYQQSKKVNTRSIWLKWVNHNEKEESIEAILRHMIKHEQNAEVEPIDPNMQYIIKSFIHYLATEFAQKGTSEKNFSYKGFQVIASAQATVDNKVYIIKRFSNNMIRLFDKNDILLEVEVKPVLREIIKTYDLNIGLYHQTGHAKNTQILGRDVIVALNNR
jgi:hypothetical protein